MGNHVRGIILTNQRLLPCRHIRANHMTGPIYQSKQNIDTSWINLHFFCNQTAVIYGLRKIAPTCQVEQRPWCLRKDRWPSALQRGDKAKHPSFLSKEFCYPPTVWGNIILHSHLCEHNYQIVSDDYILCGIVVTCLGSLKSPVKECQNRVDKWFKKKICIA